MPKYWGKQIFTHGRFLAFFRLFTARVRSRPPEPPAVPGVFISIVVFHFGGFLWCILHFEFLLVVFHFDFFLVVFLVKLFLVVFHFEFFGYLTFFGMSWIFCVCLPFSWVVKVTDSLGLLFVVSEKNKAYLTLCWVELGGVAIVIQSQLKFPIRILLVALMPSTAPDFFFKFNVSEPITQVFKNHLGMWYRPWQRKC